MYLVGADHPNKERVRELLETLIARSERLVTDAEVIQEILHRYTAIGRREAIGPCIDALLGLADEVFPVEAEDVLRARDLLLTSTSISARDAIHAVIMKRFGVVRILSFDKGFDAVPGVERIA